MICLCCDDGEHNTGFLQALLAVAPKEPTMAREWKPIGEAPRDGSPVFVRGYNYGDPNKGQHFYWCRWSDKYDEWTKLGVEDNATLLKHLTHYLAQA